MENAHITREKIVTKFYVKLGCQSVLEQHNEDRRNYQNLKNLLSSAILLSHVSSNMHIILFSLLLKKQK